MLILVEGIEIMAHMRNVKFYEERWSWKYRRRSEVSDKNKNN